MAAAMDIYGLVIDYKTELLSNFLLFSTVVYKYKKDSDVSLGDKLAKLSLHSIKKKSSRIKERFSVNLGFIDQTRDQNFEREETRYRQLEKSVRLFLRNVQIYMEEVQVRIS